ncbi:type II secretion system protein [Photobacterium lutimaris]|uniref:Prepilin-type cleavage/methylation domain-containing protein n=1 Tax=Photobacterium lutimaris TaxID=388278 RepID=A0A2T3IZ21_9GAMM|nr:type II secretion system protein [Photobacterium lutimaris]PSU33899.1 prepilin-type cleavage/methylation domain-containing protein [Photobacterium lutimaris]TDR76224.1 MSHA pilin protein MshA [Photobacterium lutimaris]
MNNKGFTLIEMVAVIILLGILAVTAAPRLLALTTDARIATLDGFSASFEVANELVHSKAIMNGLEDNANTVKLPGTNIGVNNGYMLLKQESIDEAMDLSGVSFTFYSDGKEAYFYLGEVAKYPKHIQEEQCYVHIQRTIDPATSQLFPPVVIKNYQGC